MRNCLKKLVKKLFPWLNPSEHIYTLYKKAKKNQDNIILSKYYSSKISKKYACYISPKADIGKGLLLPHPTGIVIGEGVKIGNDCTIYQNVTLGRKTKNYAEYPIIGNNVIVYCNSVIIGNVTIGDNCIIGCNSTVLKSIKSNSTCTGVVK